MAGRPRWLIVTVLLLTVTAAQPGCHRQPAMVDAHGIGVVDAHGVGPAVLPVGQRIVIVSPAPGDSLALPLTVKGYANVREGELLTEVRDSSGVLLASESTQAAIGTYVWSSFASTVTFTPPTSGPVTLIVRGYWDDYPDGQTPITHVIEATVVLNLKP